MKNKSVFYYLTVCLLVILILSPTTFVFGQESVVELQAIIEQLENQIKVLQEQITVLQGELTAVRTELTISKILRRGDIGEEVRKLQELLKLDPAVYPEGLVTGYFGPLTERAVKRFQEKHSQDVLAPLGLFEGTGIVGDNTRNTLNKIAAAPAIPATPAIPAIPAVPSHLGGTTATTTIPATPATPATPAQPATPPTTTEATSTPETATPSPTPTPTPTVATTTLETATTTTETATTTTDTTLPVISDVSASSTSPFVETILWTTNESADSQVEYGLTSAYGSQSSLDTSLTTSHSVDLSGLDASTNYYYRVKSKDAAGNLAVSQSFTFTTTAAPTGNLNGALPIGPIISDVSATNITSSGAVIIWTTDKPATSNVMYGLTSVYGRSTNRDYSLVTSHSVSLSGLQASTIYHYRVESGDADYQAGVLLGDYTKGRYTVSSDYTFTTSASTTSIRETINQMASILEAVRQILNQMLEFYRF